MRPIKTNEPTRYELVIQGEGNSFLLRYTARRTGQALAQAIGDHARRIVKLTGATEWKYVNPRKKDAGAAVGKYTVRFSGRTQREIYGAETELPFILDAIPGSYSVRLKTAAAGSVGIIIEAHRGSDAINAIAERMKVAPEMLEADEVDPVAVAA